jgi:hypothetical protein
MAFGLFCSMRNGVVRAPPSFPGSRVARALVLIGLVYKDFF